ncbi:MAG: elongation factor G [Phycisphaerae bacterium]|jgi:elongation factor G|nr:elongation factor G [Phycisphaerae bacterium]
MPASKPQDIRNIILLGHGGAGKTTLGEAMLFKAGVTNRLGSVPDHTSMLDYTDIEKEREHSVDPTLAYIDNKGKITNIIDAPGYPDFVGGAMASMAGADTAVVVISATAGIEVNTRRLIKAAREWGLPLAIVINKVDGENVDLPALVETVTTTFGTECKPLNLPTGGNTGVIDCFANDSGEVDFGDVAAAHTELVESVIESDEDMMEAYLGGEEIPAEKLGAAFGSAMVEGTIIPVFFTAAKNDVGVEEFAAAVHRFFPAPGMVAGARVVTSQDDEGAETVEVAADASKPFIAHAFKITSDPFVGKLAWIRVLQGTASGDTGYMLGDDRRSTKIGHLFKVQGGETKEVDTAVAGDVIALAKVEEISRGDVLHEDSQPMYRPTPPTPTPMYSLAVEPKSRGDEQKISEALHRLTDEDATFNASRDAQTGETVISGIGDLHLRVMLTKMSKRFNLEVDTKPPKIPYRETIQAKAGGHHRHKKQTGGAGQFGEVYLRVEPKERGEGFEFVSELFGESIPRQFLPAIEKGVHEVLANGAVAGYPMQDILVAITDGKHHPVDSKEVAFKTAGKHAFIDAVKKAKPVLLEPVVHMEITVPADYMGDIASDLSGRRGRIQGQDMLPGNIAVITAQAPLAEVMQYNSQLRSVTGGQGSYAMELSHYEPVPGNVQQAIIEKAAKAEEEEE